VTSTAKKTNRPIDYYLRVDRMPHIWCAGCGIGSAAGCFLRAIDRLEMDADDIVVVSGIGCTGRVAGYVRLDSFHTTHGRAIPFATGLKLGKPNLNVVVFSGDGDLAAIGGNHLIHAARRNVDMTVICVNNFNYGMTGGQLGPTTPVGARSSTSPRGNFDPPFNLPQLVAASGATYVARWTVLHVRQLEKAFTEALAKPGFSFVEVIAPCSSTYGRMNKLGQGVDQLHSYKKRCLVKNAADLSETGISIDGPIVVGKFLDIARPTFGDLISGVLDRARGKKTS
jgi:2-oxoglutarate ferredoxin oxidoreductase subunit beta